MLQLTKQRHSEPSTLILMSLLRAPKHGYAINKDLQSTFKKDFSYGTLYGALQRLEKQGFIETYEWNTRRRPYRLTSKGRKTIEAEIRELIELSWIGYRSLSEHKS
jgi:DNA-binding PadR family transcriptional regulator